MRVAPAALLAGLLLASLMSGAAAQTPWERSEARLPHAPDGAAVVATSWAVYLFGGLDAEGNVTGDVIRYDPDRQLVQRLPARLPAPRTDMAAVWDGQKIHLLGGMDKDGAHGRQVWRFDPFREQFVASLALLPEARTGIMAVQADTHTLVLGGTPCDPCPVLRMEGDELVPMNATLPAHLSDAAVFWDGRHVHVLGGHQNGTDTARSWRLDVRKEAIAAGPAVPYGGRAQAVYDGLHAHLHFAADPFFLWRLDGDDLRRVSPRIDTPGPPRLLTGPNPVVLLGAGVGAANEPVGIVHFDPEAAYIAARNPWCAPLARDPCDARAPGAGTPWLPFLGGVLLFVYLGAAAMALRRRADDQDIPRRERDRWIALPALAVLAMVVLSFRPWADIVLGAATGHAAPVGLDAPAATSWTDVARGASVLASTAVWGIGVAAAAVATLLLGLRQRRAAARVALGAGAALAFGWSLLMIAIHVVSDGAFLQWRVAALLAFVAVVAFVMGAFLLLRQEGPAPAVAAVNEDAAAHEDERLAGMRGAKRQADRPPGR